MAKKGKEKKPINVIDLKIADASDEELIAILEVRKKYTQEERNTLITGLIYIAALYTTGFFTTGTLSGIVTSVNKGEARKGKKT